MAVREPRRRSSADCSSRPLGRRANKRRFVSFLQQLGRPGILALAFAASHRQGDRDDALLVMVSEVDR
jgi:hypothetical protein